MKKTNEKIFIFTNEITNEILNEKNKFKPQIIYKIQN